MSCAVMRTRPDDRATEPSTTPSTPSSARSRAAAWRCPCSSSPTAARSRAAPARRRGVTSGVRHAVAEVVLRGIRSQVGQGQDRQRPYGHRAGGHGRRRSAGAMAINNAVRAAAERAPKPHRAATPRRRRRRSPRDPGQDALRPAAPATGRLRRDHRGDRPVSSPLQRLDEARVVGLVPERPAQPVDRAVQPAVEVDEGLVGPEMLPERLASQAPPGASSRVSRIRSGCSCSRTRSPPCGARRNAGPARTPNRRTRGVVLFPRPMESSRPSLALGRAKAIGPTGMEDAQMTGGIGPPS